MEGEMRTGLLIIRQIRFYVKIDTFKTVYFTYTHSHITYGICLYGATTKVNLDKILKTQRTAIRLKLDLKYRESVQECFKNLSVF